MQKFAGSVELRELRAPTASTLDDAQVQEALWIKLIGTVPAILWVAFASVVYFTLRGTIVQRLVPRVTAVRALGIEVEIAGELLAEAESRSSPSGENEGRPPPVRTSTRRAALGRLEHAADLLQGGRILWVDDHPQSVAPLAQLFRGAGMAVELTLSTDEAMPLLRRQPYDILISDIDRDGDSQAGIAMLRVLENDRVPVPVLIYTGNFVPERGVDRRIFAATTSPVELVHYVIDLMERARLTSL
ncbi:response regulator [Streptomyces olivaceus]|uniref:response regulator n=1 Tax=Streptomyces olivaceus TaxID=47716 RepID=UPI001CCC8F04|nr:response regulator [Streptomyces olivaceus]MBZ6173536.1 response regulator [Streptomyces olivaceus]MBZ6179549.1 response regulator [Streptomyces olivaceus]